jgi:lysyl-tRNA synthetase class 2
MAAAFDEDAVFLLTPSLNTMAESDLIQQRISKLNQLRDLGYDPFGGRYAATHSAAACVGDDYVEGAQVRVMGRLMTRRDMGKTHFAHIQDGSGRVQLFVHKETVGENAFQAWKLLDLGDFVGAEGTLFTTKTGERSIKVSALVPLSKAIRPLPDKWHGLADVEQRYRQRYLDLATNPDCRSVFEKRSLIVREIRRFLEDRAFMEVETPMMQAIPGGAAAQPFKTHHNALDLDLYLRIAPELYLKRLLVGGFEKVFEVNRNFRNEGISRRHNPEFTMLEAYWAGADYEQMADLIESLILHLTRVVNYEGPLDWTAPWPRKKYRDAVREAAGADWFDLEPAAAIARAQSLGVEIIPDMEPFEVTNQVFEKLVEARTVNPVFYTHLPKELVPLARQNREDPSVVDVYELIVNGQELSPGYSELNDPLVQRERLEHQAGGEQQKLDEDFLLALEHGMPPAGGLGLGIDRLIMTLTGAESIRDVILFPLLRPAVETSV